MADRQVSVGGSHHVSGMTILYTSLAGLVVGGPLLGMMGFSFLASVTLLLIASPLLVIFSPLLFCAAVVLVTAVAGFSVAATMGLVGMSSIAWIFRSFRGRRSSTISLGYEGGVTEKLTESAEKVKEQGKDWAGYLQQNVQVNSPENKVNRG